MTFVCKVCRKLLDYSDTVFVQGSGYWLKDTYCSDCFVMNKIKKYVSIDVDVDADISFEHFAFLEEK